MAIAAALLIAGCGNDAETSSVEKSSYRQPPAKQTVEITAEGYRPEVVRVLVGGTVTWVNHDRLNSMHTAESPREGYAWKGSERSEFDTHVLTWKEPYTVTFHQPGTFEYLCSLHDMQGKVEVVLRGP